MCHRLQLATVYACHLINHITCTIIESEIPTNDYDSFHIFYLVIFFFFFSFFVHVKESKLELRANRAIFIGLSVGVKG